MKGSHPYSPPGRPSAGRPGRVVPSSKPFEPVIGVEHTATAPSDDTIVVDNDVDTGPPTLAVAVSGTDRPRSVPDAVKYVCWRHGLTEDHSDFFGFTSVKNYLFTR